MPMTNEFAEIRRKRQEAGLDECESHPRSQIDKEREGGMGMDTGDEGCLVCGETWWRSSRDQVSIDPDR